MSSDSHTNILPLKTNFEKGSYVQAYQALFEGSGIFFKDTGNNVTREMYSKGYALFAFDLSEDLSGSESHLCLPRQGSFRITLTFSKPLTENVSLIILSEFDSIIEIDKNRNCVLDFAS